MDMLRAVAVAGCFRSPPGNAANDQPAALLILVLFWWQACAKYRAKLAGSSPFSRKLSGPAILTPIPLNPAWLRAFPVPAPLLALCQNDHLPTPSCQD